MFQNIPRFALELYEEYRITITKFHYILLYQFSYLRICHFTFMSFSEVSIHSSDQSHTVVVKFIPRNKHFKVLLPGVSSVAQWKQIQLGTMRSRVRSLASLSGLRIRCCRELWCRSQTQFRFCIAVAVAKAGVCSLDLTPSLGTFICRRCGP